MFEKGFFGGMFDMDNDGKLDPVERALDFGAFMHMKETLEKEDEDDDFDYDEDFEVDDD